MPPRSTFACPRRRGLTSPGVLLAVLGTLVVLGGAIYWMVRTGRSGADQNVETRTATRGRFVFTVTETGEVESSSNVEIRCDVKARGGAGTTILEIVPEGTFVQPGDFLVKLDASGLELDLNTQQIVTHNSEALMIQAENVYATAKIAKTEYLEGTFKQEEITIKGEIFVAKEDLRRAEQYLEYSQRLAAKGYVTKLQLEADRFAVDKAQEDLAAAESKLNVLRQFTKAKMLTQLESDIQTAHANWQSAKASYDLDVSKLKDIKDQIERCTIKATAVGQVKYANQRQYRGNDTIIEAGVQVREGQEIIRLPDPKQMQVEAEINETSTKYVQVDLPATVIVRSVSPKKLRGRVVKVNDYTEPGSFFSSNVKEYGTTIEILDPADNLKPGLTAEVEIQVHVQDDALQVPLPCVVQHAGRFYCVAKEGDTWQLREVQVGLNNDSRVVIRSGLSEGDRVVANPRRYRDLVRWPEIPPATKATPDSEPPASEPASPADKLADTRAAAAPRADDNRRRAGRPEAAGQFKPSTRAEGILQRLDTDRDGRVSGDELSAVPAAQKQKLMQADANGDGALDRNELLQGVARRGGDTR